MSNLNNKRIVKNTLLLYFRMLIILGVSLYTSRIVLDVLGVTDYGIYNVVGGVVLMFSFLSGTMSSASQRFFSFELGKSNDCNLKKVFSTTFLIYILLVVVVILFAETIGLWFLNNKMTIPYDRIEAANWVYQSALLSFVFTILRTPYNSVLIANENMSVYAYLSIIETFLKLIAVFGLTVFTFDKLKVYSFLTLGVSIVMSLVSILYTTRKYRESRFNYVWDGRLFYEIVNYSGWNLFGALSSVFKNQGINIILNVFFNPAINAARGVSFQVHSAVNQFAASFYTAVRPQIIKYYAAREKDKMFSLANKSSKFSFFLLLIIVTPPLIQTQYILDIWLKQVPDYAIIFTKLSLIDVLIESLAIPIMTLVQASGRVKLYQISVGGIRLLSLPASLLFLNFGYAPEIVFYIFIAVTIVCNFIRLYIAKIIVGLNLLTYYREVALKVFRVVPVLFLFHFLDKISDNKMALIVIELFIVVVFVWIFGLNSKERREVLNKILRNTQKT